MKLAEDLIKLVEHVAARISAVSAAVMAQATSASVMSQTPMMIDLSVPDGLTPIDLADGPLPVRALVYDGEDLVGEVLVWVRAGRLIGLEQAWYTDDPPSSWPEVRRVRVE